MACRIWWRSFLEMAPSLSVSYTWNTTGERIGGSEEGWKKLTLNLLLPGVHDMLVAFLGAPEPCQRPHKLTEVHLLH